MTGPTLVIMAAGMGSRFGGPKQIAPVDAQGHVIVDFSIYDALRAGFGGVVFVIKPEMEDDFRATIGARVEGRMPVAYAYQTLDALPEGFCVPEGRAKPWGTGHAVLCARKYIDGPFAVINADDFYGRTAFEAIHGLLCAPGDEHEHAMVGYRLRNTLTENGSVSRGVCRVDADGYLSGITERTRIEKRGNGAAFTEDGGQTWQPLTGDEVVSMNLWGFKRNILPEMEARFCAFLRDEMPLEPMRREFYLPGVPDALIREGKARVRVLSTSERWFGVTYPGDMEAVRAAIAAKKASGEYPVQLWK